MHMHQTGPATATRILLKDRSATQAQLRRREEHGARSMARGGRARQRREQNGQAASNIVARTTADDPRMEASCWIDAPTCWRSAMNACTSAIGGTVAAYGSSVNENPTSKGLHDCKLEQNGANGGFVMDVCQRFLCNWAMNGDDANRCSPEPNPVGNEEPSYVCSLAEKNRFDSNVSYTTLSNALLGLKRSINFWSIAFPVYCHYRSVEKMLELYGIHDWKSQEPYYESLHDKYAPVIERLTTHMGGFYIKIAQVCATRDEIVPIQYMTFCKKFEDAVPVTLHVEDAKKIVERSLKVNLGEIFSEWQDDPIGSASIGQVYRAKMKDGRKVAVKVMVPGLEPLFRSDIATLKSFCRLAMPQNVPALEEIEKQFMTEFDYKREALNLKEIHSGLKLSGWLKRVAIPEPFLDFCSREVLVMDLLEGKKLVSALKERYGQIAHQRGITLSQLEEQQKPNFKESVISANLRHTYTSVIATLYDVACNAVIAIHNHTIGFLFPEHRRSYQHTVMPPNLASIISLLLRVHAFEIFELGAFNADPHPGNILMLSDGRLGLIDYGQVKRWELQERVTYAKFMTALLNNEKGVIISMLRNELGIKTSKDREDVVYRFGCFWHDRDSDDIMQGLNVQLFLESLERADPIISINEEFVMAARCSILLRGMANAFGINVKTSEYWGPAAKSFLKRLQL